MSLRVVSTNIDQHWDPRGDWGGPKTALYNEKMAKNSTKLIENIEKIDKFEPTEKWSFMSRKGGGYQY